MTYDKSRNPNGRTSDFVMTKSDYHRDVPLYKAYETVRAYRDNLEKLIKMDIVLYPHQVMRLRHEVTKISRWLHEKEKLLTIDFIATPPLSEI